MLGIQCVFYTHVRISRDSTASLVLGSHTWPVAPVWDSALLRGLASPVLGARLQAEPRRAEQGLTTYLLMKDSELSACGSIAGRSGAGAHGSRVRACAWRSARVSVREPVQETGALESDPPCVSPSSATCSGPWLSFLRT